MTRGSSRAGWRCTRPTSRRRPRAIGSCLAKGRQVYVEGRLKTDAWDDKASGQKKYRVKVVADTVRFLGGGGAGAGRGPGGPGGARPAQGGPDDQGGPPGGFEEGGSGGGSGGGHEDIPF